MNIFKFKKNSLPELGPFRSPIFNQTKYWGISLFLFFVLLIATTIIGFNLFRSVYTESYKKDAPVINGEELIGAEKLKKAVDKRNQILNSPKLSPKDPSV